MAQTNPMPFKLLTFTLLFLLSNPRFSIADTFVVTSNADSGPGTLRDAIQRANGNGTAAIDYIHFSLPQVAYHLRIIHLTSELPPISSNIIIDGTTQPGARYGTTDAAVCVKMTIYVPSFSLLKIENAQNVQVYGMQLHYGYWQGFFGPPFRSTDLFGINIVRSTGLVVGAPGKGNVITGVVHGIYSDSEGCSDIRIQSNYFGHRKFDDDDPNEIDDVIINSESCITLGNVKDILIGGVTPAHGNVFGSPKRGINIDSRHSTGNGLIKIQNNIFARRYDKVTVIETYDAWDTYLHFGRSRNNPVDYNTNGTSDYRLELLDNDIAGDVRIEGLSDSLIILRNKFSQNPRTDGAKLTISRTTGGGIIGGQDPADANLFLNVNDITKRHSINIFTTGPITLLKNIFKCNSYYRSTTYIENIQPNTIPFVQIDVSSPTILSGRATPDSRIDLYYDDQCNACEGEEYVATVQSDAAGNWTYSGIINKTIIATATKNGYTGMFSNPAFDESARKITHPVCGVNNGSITGITTEGAQTVFWINLRTGDTVSRQHDLLNAAPGEYLFYAAHEGTCISTIGSSITLEDITPSIQSVAGVYDPTCGLSNGFINGLHVSGVANSKLEWRNESGDVIGNDVNIYQLPGGKYTLYAIDQTVGCTAISPTYELINQLGPSLNTSALQITRTTCGKADGSLKGITAINVTGTAFTQWTDEYGNPVGNGFSLENVAAGKYIFKFKDQSTCDTIYRPFTVTPLTAFNPIKVTSFIAKDGSCGRPDGSITIQSFSTNAAAYQMQWTTDVPGASPGTGPAIANLSAGTYRLLATDQNGCQGEIFSTTIKTAPIPTFDYSGVKITNDECDLQQGSISSLIVKGLTSTGTYTWLNENNAPVGDGTISLKNMRASTYRLQVSDGIACDIESKPFIIGNTDRLLAAPVYADVIIPRLSDAALTVKNHSAGHYKMYGDAALSMPVQENQSGDFIIRGVQTDLTLYIQQSIGSCKSQLVSTSIKVIDKSFFSIANAFTPNNDGTNDRLAVRIKGAIQLNYFKVYNRWGQLIYETGRLTDGWDGTWKGVPQEVGTYVWIAEGKDLLGNLIKDKGIVSLIR
ncbi:MAG: gliding motility-associated C-terminal domain-containing protein [Chitinophagaceae bacterium]|nr:MAG: gliding motility-associated C-terminal domain-containing protein [Chitinophagaceae bacterium]